MGECKHNEVTCAALCALVTTRGCGPSSLIMLIVCECQGNCVEWRPLAFILNGLRPRIITEKYKSLRKKNYSIAIFFASLFPVFYWRT